MATNDGVSFRKIDSTKLGFFDLPGEVRELVYHEYFLSLGDYNIHLINLAPDRPPRTEVADSYEPSVPFCGEFRRAVASTWYDWRLRPRERCFDALKARVMTVEDLTTGIAQLDLSYTEETIEDLIESAPQINFVWTNLEAAAKIVRTEASSYIYGENLFRVVGSFEGEEDMFGMPYHSDLDVLPQQLLARIKNLELHDRMLGDPVKVTSKYWTRTSGVWPVLLTKMVNLQNLWLTDVTSAALCDKLDLFTMAKACYIGPRPTIRVQVETVGHDSGRSQDLYRCVKVSPSAPRFLIPPLKTISLRGCVERFPRRCETSDTVDWNGFQLKQVKTFMDVANYEWRIYELVWPLG